MLHHELLSHLFDAAFGDCNFFVDKLIENISKQISTKHVALHIYLFAANQRLNVGVYLGGVGISLVLVEPSDHALKPYVDKVIFGDPGHDAKSFKVEDNFIGSFDVFEDV